MKAEKGALKYQDHFRPKAGPGLYVIGLLPLALIVNSFRYWESASLNYKIITVLSVGFTAQEFIAYFRSNLRALSSIIVAITCSILIHFLLGQSSIYIVLGAVAALFAYDRINRMLIQNLPKSFSLGEAALVSQGLALFLFSSLFLHLPIYLQHPVKLVTNPNECLSAILEVGVINIFVLIGIVKTFPNIFKNLIAFILLLGCIVLVIILCPVTDPLPILAVFGYIFEDTERILILLIYAGLLGITLAIVQWQIYRGSSTSTSVRKLFHILIVGVFFVGLLLQVGFLYVASGVIFAIFLLLETIRVLNLKFIGPILNQAVAAFVDEKDSGLVALTPIYLLVGCACPLYLHPHVVSNNADSAHQYLLPLLSGVLSVGIGDMFAGICGSRCGKHMWSGNSGKSIEGTIANIISQCVTILAFYHFGLLKMAFPQLFFCVQGIIANAVVEAKTDQVDNLIVPIFTFIWFSFA